MLDIKFVRENQDAVAEAMKNRHADWDGEAFASLDDARRAAIVTEESLQAERNTLSKQIGQLMKEGKRDEADAAKARVATIKEELEGAAARREEIDAQLRDLLLHTPNMPDVSTPVGDDENDNPEVRRWGTPREWDFEPKAHWDLGPELGIIDFERGVKLAASRFVVRYACNGVEP